LSKFTELESLCLGNNNQKRIDAGIYNKFCGSLEPLRKLEDLKVLDISNTDISDDELTIFPESLEQIYCSSRERPSSLVKRIENKLNDDSRIFFFSDNNNRYERRDNFSHPSSDELKKRDVQE